MGIPPELRVMIYTYVFQDRRLRIYAFDAIEETGGWGQVFRSTSKEIYRKTKDVVIQSTTYQVLGYGAVLMIIASAPPFFLRNFRRALLKIYFDERGGKTPASSCCCSSN